MTDTPDAAVEIVAEVLRDSSWTTPPGLVADDVVAVLLDEGWLHDPAEVAALRAVAARIETLVGEEEGRTWANPALTPHFVRKLRAALDALPPVNAPATLQGEDGEPPWSDSPSDLDQARSSLADVPSGPQPADETERQR